MPEDLEGVDLDAVKTLIAHTRTRIEGCRCGWGMDASKLGQSHALHVWRELQRVVLPDHDARVRAEECARVAERIEDDGFGRECSAVNSRCAEIARSAGPGEDQGKSKVAVFLEVARIAARYDERDAILWRDDLTVSAMCSDVFEWGTADYEPVTTTEDVELFACSLEDCRRASGTEFGPALYAARKRQMRPQGAAYPRDPKLVALFDACGPERPRDIFNPKEQPR